MKVLFIGSQIYILDFGIWSYYAPNFPKRILEDFSHKNSNDN